MELLKIRLAVFSVFNLNLLKRTWPNCSQTINTFSGSKRDWFLKIKMNTTENSLFLSIAVTIQFKCTKTLTRIQVFGVVNSYSVRSTTTKQKEDILLILISKSEASFSWVSIISSYSKPMISLCNTWEKDPKSSLMSIWKLQSPKLNLLQKIIKLMKSFWFGSLRVWPFLFRYRSIEQEIPWIRRIQQKLIEARQAEQPRIILFIQERHWKGSSRHEETF